MMGVFFRKKFKLLSKWTKRFYTFFDFALKSIQWQNECITYVSYPKTPFNKLKKHFIKTFSTSFTFEAKQNPPEKNFTSWLPYIAAIGHSCPGNFKHTLYSKSLEILHITLWDKTLIFAKIHIFNFVKNLGSVTSIFRR